MKPSKKFLRPLTFLDLLKSRARRRDDRWLWEGILPRDGIVLLTGEPYVGKTTLACALAAACATGSTLAGRATRKCSVGIVHLEHGPDELRKNLGAAYREFGGLRHDSKEVLVVTNPIDLLNPEDVDRLRDFLDEHQIGCVFIDSLRRAGSFDENSSQDVKLLRERVAPLANDQRVVVLIHHLSKGGTPRGSTDLPAMANVHVSLSRSGRDQVRLVRRSHEAGPFEARLVVERTGGKLRVSLEEKSAQGVRQAVRDAVLAHLGMTTLAISQRTKGGIRKGVRFQKLQVGNDEVDEAIAELDRDAQIRNEGTPKKQCWVIA